MALAFSRLGRRTSWVGVLAAYALALGLGAPAGGPALAGDLVTSETPLDFKPQVESFDYTRRDVMIPMRDGIELKTLILIPRGARRAPILLTRTPYGASERVEKNTSAHLSEVMGDTDVADDAVIHGGYIRVMQDVRGKYGSQGDYAMTRPLHGSPLNPGEVDHATDTYDTIDWLVNHVPESNGKVGILGISYDGFTSLMALVNPHPALRAAVPINAMVDGWLSAGSAGDMARLHGLDQVGFAGKVMSHPAYDSFWQDQALDRILAAHGVTVPTMLVHSLWDQEDIYGNIARYTRPSSRSPATIRTCSSCWGPGSTIRSGWMAAASVPSSSAAIPRNFSDCIFSGLCPAARHRARQRVRDRHQPLAGAAALAFGMFRRLHPRAAEAVSAAGRPVGSGRIGPIELRNLCLRSREAGALSAAAHSYRGNARREYLADMAGERSTGRRIAHRRAQFCNRTPRTVPEDQRRADRERGGLDQRH